MADMVDNLLSQMSRGIRDYGKRVYKENESSYQLEDIINNIWNGFIDQCLIASL